AVGSVEMPTYYPGVAAAKDAAAVSIRGGENLSGFDFKMVVPPPLKLSGRLVTTAGRRSIVRLAGPHSELSPTAPDGSFQFFNLIPGDYEISLANSIVINPPGGQRVDAQPTVVPVRLRLVDRDVTGIEWGIPPAVIAVSVEVERGGP